MSSFVLLFLPSSSATSLGRPRRPLCVCFTLVCIVNLPGEQVKQWPRFISMQQLRFPRQLQRPSSTGWWLCSTDTILHPRVRECVCVVFFFFYQTTTVTHTADPVFVHKDPAVQTIMTGCELLQTRGPPPHGITQRPQSRAFLSITSGRMTSEHAMSTEKSSLSAAN